MENQTLERIKLRIMHFTLIWSLHMLIKCTVKFLDYALLKLEIYQRYSKLNKN